MNEPRQRTALPILSGLLVLSALALVSGCDAGASVSSVQTAASVAHTAVGVAQTALPAVQTRLPGIQATAQAGATQVVEVLSDPQVINAQLQVVLVGATIVVTPTPRGAANDGVTQLAITATDTRGMLAQMDTTTRQASAGGALRLAAQYYPRAVVSLSLFTNTGGPLLSGTKAPGQEPAFQ
ncbi:MAG: hypothetical protein ACR2IK_22690 [Chloroflexota bacterium]